jgi:excisionase family DNA binding protein
MAHHNIPGRPQTSGPDHPRTGNPIGSGPQTDPTQIESLISVQEVARLLDVSRSMVYQLVRTHELPMIRIGKYFRFRRSEVTLWIDAQRSTENTR